MAVANWRLPINRGTFDRAVTIQYRSDGTSTSGFPVDDWDLTRTRTVYMARLQRTRDDYRGREAQGALGVKSEDTTRWLMGYTSTMDPDLVDVKRQRRLVYQGRVLNIVGAEHIGRKDAIELITIADPSGETA